MIQYSYCSSANHLQQILDLQKINLLHGLSEAERCKEGFVIVEHDAGILEKMNNPYPHIIALDGEKLAGYALTMLREFESSIPALVPLFQMINQLSYNGQALKEIPYCVLGQICIAKDYRGQGLFRGLYQKFREQLVDHFPLVITEVSKRNIRSSYAHQRVGFVNIHEYTSDVDGEDWIIYLWDWR